MYQHQYSVTLLSNASASGTPVDWPGGKGWFQVSGTFGGTSAQLEYLGPDGATYIATATANTANGGYVFELPPTQLKVILTGGTPSAMYANAQRIIE